MLRSSSLRLCQTVARSHTRRSASTTSSVPSLTNLETRWKTLSSEEQSTLTKQLVDLQKKDWHELSLDQKRAAYYVAFGPHGPREPRDEPNQGIKVLAGVTISVIVSVLLFKWSRHGIPTPRTFDKEWQEATNKLMREQNSNPIT
ncbi:1385_t:CDS:2, partial [Ambispora gerdemannii]